MCEIKCKFFGIDGICTKSKGDEVTEFCVEGPCGNENFDEKKVREPQLDYRKMAILAAIKEFKLIAEIAKHKNQKIHGTTVRLYEKFVEALERPRFSDLERDALETMILAAQQVTCPNAKNCSGCGKEGKDCEDKSRSNAIALVRKMLGPKESEPKESEPTGPNVSIGFAAREEDLCSKMPATWRHAVAGILLECGTGSSDTASLGCDTGSSDTTFPVPDGHK